LNEISLKPQDVIKAVVSVQEENVKLKKGRAIIRDKTKGLKQIDATNSRNKWSAVSSSAGGS
jgi:hypothetical protein